MGGLTSEYLAIKIACKGIMINPAITPNELLPQFIAVTENYEAGKSYCWEYHHCEQYQEYEQELESSNQRIDRTIFLDMADELIDAEKTFLKYQEKENVVGYDGGSHSFEHIRQALPVIEQVIFG